MQEQQHKELEHLKAELQRKADLTGEQAEIAVSNVFGIHSLVLRQRLQALACNIVGLVLMLICPGSAFEKKQKSSRKVGRKVNFIFCPFWYWSCLYCLHARLGRRTWVWSSARGGKKVSGYIAHEILSAMGLIDSDQAAQREQLRYVQPSRC